MYSIAGKRTAMPTEHELYLLRDTVRVERFQFLIEDVGECLKARASRVKFVVPRTPLRRQRALAVYESDVGLGGQRCQHGRELLQHGLEVRGTSHPAVADRWLAKLRLLMLKP